ncbi:MAG: protein BatD [Bacteroidales bacterium]|nr:protein BatD [Bacteroidales bacterium]
MNRKHIMKHFCSGITMLLCLLCLPSLTGVSYAQRNDPFVQSVLSAISSSPSVCAGNPTVITFGTANQGQPVQVKVNVPSTVGEGQQFRLTYTSTEQLSNLQPPQLKDFTLLGGPSTSSSTSMQVVNGQVSRSSSYSYTYILQADRQGEYTIPPATATVNGKTIKTAGATIRVTAAASRSASAPSGGGTNQRQTAQDPASSISKNDFFIRAEVSKTNPYVEEEVVVRYKLYVPAGVRFDAQIKKKPSYTGLWSYDLGDRDAHSQSYRETYNGKAYIVTDLLSVAVYPQKAGTLTISPLEVEMVAQIVVQRQRSNDPFEDFFNMFGGQSVQNIRLEPASKPVTIQAKALPEAGRPDDFSGLVGKFSFTSNLSRDALKSNDATNLVLTVSGKGNLQHAEAPQLVFPTDIEAQEPVISDKITTSEKGGVSGSRSFEYVMIPREAGEYEIPAASFSYFDPVARKYVTLHSSAYTLKVAKGDGRATSVGGSVHKKDVKIVGNDIRFIHTDGNWDGGGGRFFLSPLYWVLLLLPLILFVVFLLVLRKRISDRRNIVAVKDKRASKVARRRLKTAGQYLKAHDDARFYEEISQVLWGYVSDKFHLPLGQLSMDTARQKLSERNMNPERIDEFLETLNQCEYVRFAPSADITPEKMYEKTFAFITRMEQELKNL